MSVAPGWYPDPADPSTQRYWDGEGWVGDPLPVDATPPPGPPPTAPPPAVGPPTAPAAAVEPPPPGPRPPYHHWAPPRPHGMALAPLGARLVARLIDIAVVFGLNVIANGWFVWRYMQEVGPLLAEAGRRMLVRDPSTEGLPEPDPSTGNLLLTILLVAAAVWFAYEVPSIADHGQTLGKRVMRIKVVSLTDDPRLTFGRSLRRWNTLGLPVLLWSCGVGFVLQLIDCMLPLFDRPFRQALHDKQAQTVVVQVPATPVVPTQSPTDTATHIPGGSDDRP